MQENNSLLFQNMITKNADGTLIIDPQGVILFSNPAAQQMMGRSESELAGEFFGSPLMHGDKAEVMILPKTENTPRVVEMRVVDFFWQGKLSYLATLRDMTERKRATDMMQLQRDLAIMLSSSHDLPETLDKILDAVLQMVEIDAGGIYLVDRQTFSLQLRAHKGLSPDFVDRIAFFPAESPQAKIAFTDQALFLPISDDLPDADIMMSEGICGVAILPIHYNGQIIAMLNLASFSCASFSSFNQDALTTIAAQIGGFITRAKIENDLRQKNAELEEVQAQLAQKLQLLQQIQTKLLHSEKIAAMGELVAGLAHEINNPLASVMLHAQFLLDEEDVPEWWQQNLSEIVGQSHRIKNIAKNLLRYVQPQMREARWININTIIESALVFLSYELRSHNIRVKLQLADGLPLVYVDENQMQQVLINLINNAFQAMYNANRNGNLTIKTEVDSPLRLDGNRPSVVRILIKDDGPGIPSEVQGRVFDRFFTTKQAGEGIGIGLALCQSIVSDQNGTIWFESTRTKGTSFFIELPVETATPIGLSTQVEDQTQAPQTHSDQAQTLQAMSILVIDDEQSIVNAIETILSGMGYAVDGTVDAQDALANYIPHKQYDLIISDLMMPKMDGITFYGELVDRWPTMVDKLLFITGDTISSIARRFLAETQRPYLRKPFELGDLVTAVRENL